MSRVLLLTGLYMQVHHPALGKSFLFPCDDWLKGPPGTQGNNKKLSVVFFSKNVLLTIMSR
jgi:hypothetical protein